MEGKIGMIKMVVGDQLADGWAWADGSLLDVAAHPGLFAMIGNRYGGDGEKTFALPQLPEPEIGKYVICTKDNFGKHDSYRGLISQICLFLGSELPDGWMFCDGRVLAGDKYPVLLRTMKNTYGGDGVTTVGLPNMAASGGISYIICVEGVDPTGLDNGGAEEDDDDF